MQAFGLVRKGDEWLVLKNFGYDGAYHDMSISVSVLLENPLEWGIEATELVFSVALRAKNGDTPNMEDFTFYVMDEADRLYDTRIIPYSKPVIETPLDDGERERRPDGLIYTDFKHHFLFQDIRIAFQYRFYRKISIIELKH